MDRLRSAFYCEDLIDITCSSAFGDENSIRGCDLHPTKDKVCTMKNWVIRRDLWDFSEVKLKDNGFIDKKEFNN